jgi:hypothetical protein
MAMKEKNRARFALLAMTVVVGVMTAMILVGTAAAQENDPYSNRGPKVLPSVIERGEPDRPDVVEDEFIPPPPEEERSPLPFTGADLTLFVATGLAAIATGSVILRRTRSRSLQ